MRGRAVWLALFGALLLFYSPVLFGKVLVDRDLFRIFIPQASLLKECLQHGEWPLWDPYQRLGQPFAATLYSQVYYPPHVLLLMLFEPARAMTLQVILHIGILAAGIYWLCRELGRSRAASLIAAGVGAFPPVIAQMTSQLNILSAMAWTGFLVVAARRLILVEGSGLRVEGQTSRGSIIQRTAILASLWALSVLAGSPEVIIWQAVIIGLVVLFEGTGSRRLRPVGGLAWAFAISAIVLLPAAELTSLSTRKAGVENQLAWSASPKDLFGLGLLQTPDSATPRSDFLPTTFIGTLGFVAAVAGVVVARKEKRARPFAIAAGVLALLSLGSAFFLSRWLLLIPPLHLFRYPSRYLIGAVFALAVLSAFGVDALRAEQRRWVGFVIAATAIPLFVLHVLGLGAPSAAAVVLILGLVLATVRNERARVIALALICLVELYGAQLKLRAPGWLPWAEIAGRSAFAGINREDGGGRISVDLESDQSRFAPDHLVALSGEVLYPLRWYEDRLEALEGYGAPEPLRHTLAVEVNVPGRALYDVASVRSYVRAGKKPFDDLRARLKIESGNSVAVLSESGTPLPRAFIVHKVANVSDEELLQKLSSDTQEFRTTAFTSENVQASGDCQSTATREDPDHRTVIVHANACAPGVLVVNDSWYPGWKVTLDDQPSKAFVVDYLFRGVEVPKGEHTVRMHYEPLSSIIGSAISALSVIALFIALARKRKTATPEGAAVSRQQPDPA